MSFVAIAVGGAAVGLAGGIGKAVGRGKANKKMGQLLKEDPTYKANPLANERLSLTRTLLNARMPGSVQRERNIFTNQGNQIANISQNATDSSQALALASQSYGNTGNQLSDLGIDEAQDYQRRQGNLFNAQEGVINEEGKVFDDSVRRHQNKFQVEGAINENRQNTWGDLSNFGFGVASLGFQGMNGGFGGGSGGTSRSTGNYNGSPVAGRAMPNYTSPPSSLGNRTSSINTSNLGWRPSPGLPPPRRSWRYNGG